MLERPSDDSDPADAAIEEYLRLLDAGVEVDRSAFIASHPEAAKKLRSFFGSLSMLQKLAGAGGLAQNYGSELTTRSSRDAAGRKRSEDEGGDSRLPWTSLPAMFGRYRVESLLGRGAMGAVYRAHDTQLDRPVALKLSHLPENIVFELRERMLQEARAAAALSNTNICRVYDVGEIGGTRFIAMELIEGRPLADYIRSGRLMPIKTAVAIIRKLALALKAAHDKGVVHRDLKPTNVIINADHEPILMDFGLAQRPVATGEERLTKEGMLIGSPAYMSPEQARADGTSIGPASDIYSLGVVFYELLTGQLPFTGSVMTILAKVLSEVPPTPQSIRPEIDRDLSDVCRKMLAKLPQERFVSMEEVAECLQRWLKSVAKTSQNTASKTESSAKSGAPSRPTPNQAKSSIISKPESVGNATVRGNQDDFDGYRKWLGITSKSRPPSHYELLKISLDEDDDDVIKAAAEQRRHYVESQRGQGYDDSVAEIVYRIHEAEITLLNSEMRREYDRQLGLFEKRRKNRQVDPFAPVPRIKSRPGPTVGEDNGIVKTFAGIVAVLCIAFAGMAIFAFKVLPWSKQPQNGDYAANQSPLRTAQPVANEIQPNAKELEKKEEAVPAKATDPKSVDDTQLFKGKPPAYVGSTTGEARGLIPGIMFRWCPPGSFTIGSPNSELEQDNKRRDDEDQVPVTLSSGFWLAETETTQNQWRKVMGTSPWQGKEHVNEGDDCAASYISHNEAVTFLEKLTSQERLANRCPDGWKYALPSEAQWEHACRAGTQTKYSFGDSESDGSQYGLWLNQHAWWGGIFGDGNANTERFPHRVGQKKPNAWGLRDMHGNVSEWCSDWYGKKLFAGTDPVGASSGTGRVRRGGGWSSGASGCRSARRGNDKPENGFDYLGFRIAAVRQIGVSEKPIVRTPANASDDYLVNSEQPIELAWQFTASEAKATQERLAKSLGTKVVVKNSLGMELVLIPPGTFMMGTPPIEKGPKGKGNQMKVTLTSPFWLGKTEVTQGQWRKVMGTTPWKGKSGAKEGPNYPASNVHWNHVQEFVKELSKRDGATYRLPTEAEWEWSCRAGTSSRWSFGDNESDLGRFGWYGMKSGGNTKSEHYAHEVGKKLPNPFGLHDMHGNVWEWCEDEKAEMLPGGTNPKVMNGTNQRVFKGGSWYDGANGTRSANRDSNWPGLQEGSLGFRVLRTQ